MYSAPAFDVFRGVEYEVSPATNGRAENVDWPGTSHAVGAGRTSGTHWDMPIPDYQTVMLPLLRFLGDGREHTLSECVETVANKFKLTPEERLQFLPSGTSTVIGNRVGWARTYMKKAGLLESPRRGVFRITERGAQVLSAKPTRVDVKFLEQFPEFVEFRSRAEDDSPSSTVTTVATPTTSATPEEALEDAHDRLRAGLESELLQRVMGASPAFFERLVIDLLVRMGYGGSFRDAGQAIGRSGDGGIDGIIKEDRLGLDVIYVQAKRWESSVGRPRSKSSPALFRVIARVRVFSSPHRLSARTRTTTSIASTVRSC